MENKLTNQGSIRHARRRAERVPEVAQRHQHHKALAILTPGLQKAASDVISRYDDDESYTANTESLLQAASTKVDALHEIVVRWVDVVRSDVPGFSPDRFGFSKRSYDDVLVGAKLLIEVVNGSEDTQPALPYASDVEQDVKPALSAAEEAVSVAKTVRVKRKEKRAARREAVTRMHHELVRYRRVLARYIGRNHPDYVALRYRARVQPVSEAATVTRPSQPGEVEAPERASLPSSD